MPRRDRSRYSRAVRWLKVALPLLALGLLSAIFLIPRDTGFDGGLIYSTADLIALGEGLSVSNPRFTGATDAGEPVSVRAKSATPDGPDPSLVTLDTVEAALDQTDGRSVTLVAASGALRPKDNTLSLEGGVVLTTSDGYRVETERIDADLRAGEAIAPGPVVAEGPQGRIEAGSFRARRIKTGESVTDEGADGLAPGDYLWFENRVRVVYVPSPTSEKR